MQMIVAGLMALTAMGASILADVDPVTVVSRGGIAFLSGVLLTSVWTSVVNPQPKAEKAKKQTKAEPAVVESKSAEPEPEAESENVMEEAA